MKQYLIDKYSQIKEWVKKEKYFLLLLLVLTVSLLASMFTKYALIAVFLVAIGGAILFNFEKGLCIFLFTCAFEAIFYIKISGKNFFAFTIFYSVLFLVYFLKYLLLILKKQKRVNIKILIPFILCIIYILLPINPIRFDDVMKYVIAFGVIYLMIEQKEDFNFGNILITTCVALIVSILMSYLVNFSDRMSQIMEKFYDDGLIKMQALFKNPNFLVEYSVLVLAGILYRAVFSDTLWFLPILIILPYTYKTLSRNYLLSLLIIYAILFIFVCIKHKKTQVFKFLAVVLCLSGVCVCQIKETKSYVTGLKLLYNETCKFVGIDSYIRIPSLEEKEEIMEGNGADNQVQDEIKPDLWIDGKPLNPGRGELWKRYYRDFSSSPKKIIFGVGISPELLATPPHNTFVNLVWQFGIFGTTLILSIFWLIFKEMLKGKKIFSILLTILICFVNMCEGNLFNYLAIAMVVFLITSSKCNENKLKTIDKQGES